MSHIILCGLPTCGKTTIGQLMAVQLNWSFIDTDKNIETAYSAQAGLYLSCREIFQKDGETIFRAYERQAIADIICNNPCVIATGGGSLCCPLNTKRLQGVGPLVYLKTSLEILWERTLEKGLPAYLHSREPKQAFYQLAAERVSIYESIANVTIETDSLSHQEVVNAVIDATANLSRN